MNLADTTFSFSPDMQARIREAQAKGRAMAERIFDRFDKLQTAEMDATAPDAVNQLERMLKLSDDRC
jgi:hypothetical protein